MRSLALRAVAPKRKRLRCSGSTAGSESVRSASLRVAASAALAAVAVVTAQIFNREEFAERVMAAVIARQGTGKRKARGQIRGA